MNLTANPIDPDFLGDEPPHRYQKRSHFSLDRLVEKFPKTSAVLVVAGLLAASSESGPFPDEETNAVHVPREYIFPSTGEVRPVQQISNTSSDTLHNFSQFLQRAERELASVRVEQNMWDDVYHDFVQTLARLYAMEDSVNSGAITPDVAQKIILWPEKIVSFGSANLALWTYPTPQNRPRHINIQTGDNKYLVVGLRTPF